MKENSVSITIPIYKSSLTTIEICSLEQCFKVLGGYPICLITHINLDLTVYKRVAELYGINLKIEYFDEKFFANIDGYNNLMLNALFYKRFEKFEYMLIYQLDAWVFKDELLEWCTKGFDYIGSPWFKNQGTHEEGEKLWLVGNGGFSLRKVCYFINCFTSTKNLRNYKQLKQNCVTKADWIKLPLRLLGIKNSVKHLVGYFEGVFNEDLIYCMCLQNTQFEPKLPNVMEGLKFSFERSPSYLFELNNSELPFGCHAFEKNEFESFWSKHIDIK